MSNRLLDEIDVARMRYAKIRRRLWFGKMFSEQRYTQSPESEKKKKYKVNGVCVRVFYVLIYFTFIIIIISRRHRRLVGAIPSIGGFVIYITPPIYESR